MKHLIKISKAGTGYVADYIGDSGEKLRDYVMEVIGAIIPPEGQSLGYYLFLGMMFDQTPAGPHKILFLSEGLEQVRTQLIFNMNDDAVRLNASTVYADQLNKGFFAHLWNINSSTWWLKPAASTKNIDYGSALINEILVSKAIDWPKDSTVYTQVADPLQGINEGENLKDPKFYAFHALRFILAGIERDIQVTNKTRQGHYDLEARRFHKPMHNKAEQQSRASGAVL